MRVDFQWTLRPAHRRIVVDVTLRRFHGSPRRVDDPTLVFARLIPYCKSTKKGVFTGWTTPLRYPYVEWNSIEDNGELAFRFEKPMNVKHLAARLSESRNVASVSSHRRAHHGIRLAVAACVFLFASVPAPGQETPANKESPRLGSIHGTLSTKQDNTSAGLAGITVKLIAEPLNGSAMTADAMNSTTLSLEAIRFPSANPASIRSRSRSPSTLDRRPLWTSG
jgi:hypothetical protein